MDEADAHAAQHQFTDGEGVGRLEARAQGQAAFAERGFQAAPAGVFGVQGDEVLLDQLFDGEHLAVRQRVGGGHGDDTGHFQEKRVLQPHDGDFVGHQAQVELAGHHLLHDFARAQDLEGHLHPALGRIEGGDGARHEAHAQRGQRADGHAAHAKGFQAADAVFDLFEAGKAAIDLDQQRVGLLGGQQAVAHAVKEAQAGLGFQAPDGLADGRLGDIQHHGGLAGGARAHHGAEDLDIAHVHSYNTSF